MVCQIQWLRNTVHNLSKVLAAGARAVRESPKRVPPAADC